MTYFFFLGFLSLLMEMNKKIQAVQKSLETYLESKRHAFPRFYFISDDDLLSIIGQNSPKDIQPHLQKCFAGISRLEMINVVEEKGVNFLCNFFIKLINIKYFI